MAACLGAKLSLSSGSVRFHCRPNSFPHSQQASASSFPIKGTPIQNERDRMRGIVLNCSSLSLSSGSVRFHCRPNSFPHFQLASASSFPIKGTPIQNERDRMRGIVLNSSSSAEKGLGFRAGVAEAGWRRGGREKELYGDYDQVDYAQIDAFTDRAYSGNPAAVVVLPEDRDDKWLQLLAREFNLSETAYLVRRSTARSGKGKKGGGLVQVSESGTSLKATKTYAPLREKNEFNLRWFTPTDEVDLCGHATLASAHLLFSSGIVEGDTAIFHTRSGVLTARKVSGYREYKEDPDEEEEEKPASERRKPSDEGVVQLDFPSAPPIACDDASLLSKALGGVEVKWAGLSSLGDYLVEVQSGENVENIKPKFELMLDLPGRAVIVTAPGGAGSEYDFVSRFFGPKVGVKEDPATGSAHCTLGPYWASKLGKTELIAYQASQRGGKFLVRVDEEAGRCYLQGGAILVMAGVAGIR